MGQHKKIFRFLSQKTKINFGLQNKVLDVVGFQTASEHQNETPLFYALCFHDVPTSPGVNILKEHFAPPSHLQVFRRISLPALAV